MSKKGPQYERAICRRLSLWVSDGELKDCFWRSASSGGMSTRNFQATGKHLDACAGDITATRAEGNLLTTLFVIECKSYKGANAMVEQVFFGSKPNKLIAWWNKLLEECADRRHPMLFLKINHRPELLFTSWNGVRILRTGGILKPHLTIDHPIADLCCLYTQKVFLTDFQAIRDGYQGIRVQ